MAVKKQALKQPSGKTSRLSDAHLDEIARLFSMLAESSRLKLLRALLERPMTVSELIDATGLKQGNVSKQLGMLLTGGFVGREREGNFARYSITDPTIAAVCTLMCSRIEAQARHRAKQFA